MAIYKGDKRAVIYRGDYRPAELYKGSEKAAGYTVETVSGRSAKVDDTYNDRLDISVQGHHTQETQAERKVDFVGTAEFVANEESYLGAAVFEGRHEQKKYTGINQFDISKWYVGSSATYGIKTEIEGEYVHMFGTPQNTNVMWRILWTNDEEQAKLTTAHPSDYEHIIGYDDAGEIGLTTRVPRFRFRGASSTDSSLVAYLTGDVTGKPLDIYFRLCGNITTKPTVYEPFVGGKPSPSPSYPQPIDAVQEERVEVRGRNLVGLGEGINTLFARFNRNAMPTAPNDITIPFPNNSSGSSQVLVFTIKELTPADAGIKTHVSFDLEINGANDSYQFYAQCYTSKNVDTTLGEYVSFGSGYSIYVSNHEKIHYDHVLNQGTVTSDGKYLRVQIRTDSKIVESGAVIRISNLFAEVADTTEHQFEPFHSPSSYSHSLTLYGDGTANDSFDMVTGKYTKWWEKISLPVSEMNNHEDYAGWRWRTGTAKIRDLFPNVNGTFAGATKWFCNYCREGININTMGANDIVFLAAGVIFPERKQSEIISAHSDLVFEIVYKLPAAEVSYLDPSTVELIDGTNLLTTQPSASGTVVLDPLKPSPLFPTEIKGTEGAEVEVEGVNLFPYNGTYDVNVDYVKPNNSVWNPIELNAGIYTLSIFGDDSFRHYNSSISFRDKTGAVFAWTRLHTIGTNSYVFSIDKEVAQLAVYINQKVTGVSIMIERGDKASPYVPYREGSKQILPFTLYGANGIFDTCEPCVLVDGVERCRVTRRWKFRKVSEATRIYGGGYQSSYAHVYMEMSTPNNKPIKQTGTPKSNSSTFVHEYKQNYSLDCWFISSSTNTYDRFVLGEEFWQKYFGSTEEFIAWCAAHPDEGFLCELAEPVVEYYDPLPLSTIPHCTIINSSADFTAAVKRVER